MEKQGFTLEAVALAFLTSLPPEERKEKQQEVNKFVLWYGKERLISQITPVVIANYAGSVAASTGDATKKLEPVRSLLTYAKKEKLIKTSLAPHLRIKQTSSKTPIRTKPRQQIALTAEDYALLKSQLSTLEEERVHVAEEMRIAAADKDFRENAPLHAAREHRDHIEAQMKEIQTAITTGVVVEAEKPMATPTVTVRLRTKVVLRDIASGKELTYTLVTKNEANPANGKISIISPIGKALLNQPQGAVVKVTAPAGELHYQIQRIE